MYAGATDHCCCCTRLFVLLAPFCRISKFVNFDVRVFDVCDRFFFYTNASTFRDWFLRTGMRSRGQWVGLPHSSAIAQVSLSTVKLCISVIDVNCFRVLWSETLVQWFDVTILCVQQCLYCINTNFRVFVLSGYLIFLLPLFHKFLEQSRPATLQNRLRLLWCH